jgi:putative phosphoribosyl transferase
MTLPFQDRSEAGRLLARALDAYRARPGVLVLALPRGGVPVAFEVAEYLDAPLDVFLVRKLGVPGQPELAFGAIASGGVRVLNEDVVSMMGMNAGEIEQATARERVELVRRDRHYRGGRPALDVKDKTVILVDDGLATGATMLAAVRALRVMQPKMAAVAVPLAARETRDAVAREVDEMICLETPSPFQAVGVWYEDFSQIGDEEVIRTLARRAPAPTSFT